jgi:transporter family-2 protein
VLITYGVGAIAIVAVAMSTRLVRLDELGDVPWYAWLAGLCGLVIVGAVSYGVGRVGVVQALVTFTAAQFAFSALIDHQGWFGAQVRTFDVSRLSGVTLLVLGAWLVTR